MARQQGQGYWAVDWNQVVAKLGSDWAHYSRVLKAAEEQNNHLVAGPCEDLIGALNRLRMVAKIMARKQGGQGR